MPTAIFHAQISIPQEKKSWPYKRSHVEWSFEEKVQNGTILELPSAKLQQLVFLCCVSVAGWGYWAQSRMSGVWLRYQRVLIFCVVVPVFSLKLEGPKLASVRTEWSNCLTFWWYSYSMRRICHSQKLQLCWLFKRKTGQMVKKIQMSGTAEIIPWNCAIKLSCSLKKSPQTSNCLHTCIFFRPHLEYSCCESSAKLNFMFFTSLDFLGSEKGSLAWLLHLKHRIKKTPCIWMSHYAFFLQVKQEKIRLGKMR